MKYMYVLYIVNSRGNSIPKEIIKAKTLEKSKHCNRFKILNIEGLSL